MRWKQEQATKEEYRSIGQVCRDSARKDKTQLKLVMEINGNKNSFYQYICIKSSNNKNMGCLLNGGVI